MKRTLWTEIVDRAYQSWYFVRDEMSTIEYFIIGGIIFIGVIGVLL